MTSPADATGSASIAALYQERILDHYRRPRCKGTLERATGVHVEKNPLCGDAITVAVFVQDGVVVDARYSGAGCSIMQAAASMLMELVHGRAVADVAQFGRRFEAMLASGVPDDALGELAALSGVAGFPARQKCARLPWRALHGALEQSAGA